MPRRVRTDALETQSRAAFESLMNQNNWVFEPFERDYGIDGRVELFEGERATGKIFFVQLKATDEPDLEKALALSIALDHIHYWASVDTPVCLVRYISHGGRFFLRWLNSFPEPHETTEDQKTVTLHLAQEDEFSSNDRFTRLEHTFNRFRALRTQDVPRPLGVQVKLDPALPAEVRRDLQRSFRAVFQEAQDFYSAGETALFTIQVEPRHLMVKIPGLYQRKSELPLLPIAEMVEHLAYDACTFMGLALRDFGRTREAGQIMLRSLSQGTFLQGPRGLDLLAPMVQEAKLLSECLETARHAVSSGRIYPAQMIFGFILPLLHEASPAERATMIELLRDIVSFARAQTPPDEREGVASTLFNLVVALRVQNLNAEALDVLDQTHLLDPDYPTRYHWQLERGRILFELERFQESGQAYEEGYARVFAVPDLTPWAHEILLFAADGFLYAGQYQKALDRMTRALDTNPLVAEEFHLKRWLLDWLVSNGLKLQTRRPVEGLHTLSQAKGRDFKLDKVVLERIIGQGLSEDALLADAWLLAAKLAMSEGDFTRAKNAYLAAAILQPSEVDLWVEFLYCSALCKVNSEEQAEAGMLFACAMVMAYWHHENDLLIALEDASIEEIDEDFMAYHRNIFDFIAHQITQAKTSKRLVPTPWGVTTVPWIPPSLLIEDFRASDEKV